MEATDAVNVLRGIKSDIDLDTICKWVHAANETWWKDPITGERVHRNYGELMALVHSEISESLEGHRKNKRDDHLPQYMAYEMELVDALIRIFDILGALSIHSPGEMLLDKLDYNANRADHKPENRVLEGGKKY